MNLVTFVFSPILKGMILDNRRIRLVQAVCQNIENIEIKKKFTHAYFLDRRLRKKWIGSYREGLESHERPL